jgi:putative protease
MKNRIELLAPAGSMEALHAAVENGADAVYLGGRLLNARQLADNFDTEGLEEALVYAHARGVNIYLTLNTLVSDKEMKQALRFAAEAAVAGIDGIIVQDLGLAASLGKLIPGVPLHGSTQMTIYDSYGAKVLEGMGFKRVVLAREVPLEEAAQIVRDTSLEVEMFVHGALCVCYSGQCLMSSIIGGRSGNRGKCAQPCRLPYELAGESCNSSKNQLRGGRAGSSDKAGYLLSPKDICLLEHIGEMAAAGISSLKIEGRMKSPEYVAVVVKTYRKYLDAALKQMEKGRGTGLEIDKADMHDLLQIFNRGGFSSGYLKGKTGADMMCYDKPNNSGIYLGTVTAYDSGTQMVGIKLEDRLNVGDGVEIWTGGPDSPGGTVSSVKKGGTGLKSAGKGETVFIGNFKGKITPGLRVYKTTDVELMKTARETFAGKNRRKVEISGRVSLKREWPLSIDIADGEGNTVHSEGTILPETALNRPMTADRLREQLEKTGSTPFVFDRLQVELDEGLSLPVSEINEVRRKALERLYEIRTDRYKERESAIPDAAGIEERMEAVLAGSAGESSPAAVPKAYGAEGAGIEAAMSRTPRIALYFYKWNADINYAGFHADRIYLPASASDRNGFADQAAALRNAGAELFLWLPPVTRGNYSKLVQRLGNKPSGVWDGILAGNPGTIQLLKEKRQLQGEGAFKLAGDISLNLYNSQTAFELAELGLDSMALSAELTLQQIHALSKQAGPALEAVVYGRLPLMTSEYCPVGSAEGGFAASGKCSGICGKCEYRLKDRMGAEFPVFCDRMDCRSTILNSTVLFVPDGLRSLKSAGIDIFRLYVWEEEPDAVEELVRLYRAALAGDEQGVREHGRLADRIRASGFTKGHYYRGV